VLTLTPRIIRVLELTEADLRPFRVAKDGAPPFIDLPLPPELPRQEPMVPGQKPPGEDVPPAAFPQPAQPVKPRPPAR
jgi:hypothetical protein